MNFFEIRDRAYTYLGYGGVTASEETDAAIRSCLAELEKIVHFRYLHKIFVAPPDFLLKEPYLAFLHGCEGVILCATTLGAEADRRIKTLARVDMASAVVWNAVAAAVLEQLADAHEKTLGDTLTYRFCPGYGGSSVHDLPALFDLLHPEKIGITLTDSLYMLPEKSMAGILGIGKRARKSCKDCLVSTHCVYKKEGKTCYGSEKN